MPADRTALGTLVVATVTVVWLGIVAVAALDRAPWGDEQHYLETVQRFGQDMGLETLRTYPGELAPPLAFALYAWWGPLVGFALPRLRVLSLIVAFLTVLAVHKAADHRVRHAADDERLVVATALGTRRSLRGLGAQDGAPHPWTSSFGIQEHIN
jgi:hypothetical protein